MAELSKSIINVVEPSPIYQFNSENLVAKDRYDYWEDVVCARLSPSENRLLCPRDQFSASLDCNTVGTINVCRLQSSPLVYIRSPKMISKLPNDDIFIAVIEKGQGYIEQYGRQSLCRAGDTVVYDSANAFSWSLTEQTQMMVAMIPRTNFNILLPKLKRITAQPIHPDHYTSSLIRSNIFESIGFRPNNNAAGTRRIGNSFCDIILSALDLAYFEDDRSVRYGGIIERAKRFMKDNIDDPGLAIDTIVHHVGASRRTLARAFAAEGITVTKWLWEERLDYAFCLLQRSDVRNVSQAVMQSGFNDFSHFSRSFKNKYGVTPKMVLKKAMARQ